MTCKKIDWSDNKGVPMSDARKEQYAQDVIKMLRKNPDEGMVYIACGDTLILGTIDSDGNIQIQDLEPRRWAFVESQGKSPAKGQHKCTCATNTLIKSGCQCGGN